MTPQELENIERAFDKAKMAGPQALHDWAYTFAPLLFAEVKHLPPINSDDPRCDTPANLASDAELNDSTDGAFWAEQFAIRVRANPALGTDRGFLIGWFANAIENGKRNGGKSSFNTEDALDAGETIGELVDALRPFAALGAPVCLTALEEYRILNDVPEDLAVFAVPNMDGEGALAFVTAEQLKAAHDLINEIDGGGGA